MSRLRYILSYHLVNTLFLQMGAGTRRSRGSEGTSRHISHLAIAVEWWSRVPTLHRCGLLLPKYLVALLRVVMVHRVMHGGRVLFLGSLVIYLSVTTSTSHVLKVIVLLPHQIIMSPARLGGMRAGRVVRHLHRLRLERRKACLRAAHDSLRM
jgi:hypothetical protein